MARIGYFQFVTRDPYTAPGVASGQGRPIELRQKPVDRLSLDKLILPNQQRKNRLVVIKNATCFIEDQHAIFDSVEQSLQKTPFASEPLDHALQPFFVKPADSIEHFAEETGFGSGHFFALEPMLLL